MELPPNSSKLTDYDRAHFVTYLQVLDADAAGADWWATATAVLHVDPTTDRTAARHVYDAHLARASWMTTDGYKLLLR